MKYPVMKNKPGMKPPPKMRLSKIGVGQKGKKRG